LSGRANSAPQALCGWILETELEGKRGRVKGKGRKVGGEGDKRKEKGKEGKGKACGKDKGGICAVVVFLRKISGG